MQDAGGILRQPVQKLAASIRFCPTGQNRQSSPISSTKTKKSELVPDGTGSDFLFLSEMLHIDFHACAPLPERGTGAFFFADLQNSNVKRLSCQIFRPAASILTAAVPYSDIPLPHRIRQGQQIVLQFIRIPINWRFILWNMGISGSQQRNRTSKGS